MHITFETSIQQIKDCFNDFKSLQESTGLNIQITEFDLSLSSNEVLKTIGDKPHVSYEYLYTLKKNKIKDISSVINVSNVKLSGLTYWSLTDKVDCNLERVRASLLNKGIISDINQVPTVCGGFIATAQPTINVMNNAQNINDSNNNRQK